MPVMTVLNVWVIWILNIRACFEFHASNFEFSDCRRDVE